MARVAVLPPGEDDIEFVTLALSPGYGAAVEVAHGLLALALTAAEWPLILDADTRLHRFPPGSIRAIATWEREEG